MFGERSRTIDKLLRSSSCSATSDHLCHFNTLQENWTMLPTINTPDRQAEALPVLTPKQIDSLRPYGNIRSVRAAEVLFEPGESGMSCFVVLSGKLDIAVPG